MKNQRLKSSTALKNAMACVIIFIMNTTINGQYIQTGGKLVGTGAVNSTIGADQGINVSLSADGKTLAVAGDEDSLHLGAVWVYVLSNGNWIQDGKKLVGTGAVGGSYQGGGISLSADGKMLAVGGSDDNNGKGAVWTYIRNGNTWSQIGKKLVPDTIVGYDGYGEVSLSADGNTLVVGGGSDNKGLGAVWTYSFTGSNWTQIGSILRCSGAGLVDLSGDGKTLASGGCSGVSIYTLDGTNWSAIGSPIYGNNLVEETCYCSALSLSSNGNLLAIGQYDDNNLTGAAWVFTLSGSNWGQIGSKILGAGESGFDHQGDFGISVSLNSNGSILAVGGIQDGSGIGAVWMYSVTGSNWSQIGGKLIGSGSIGTPFEGEVSLSGDGNTLAIGGNADNDWSGAAWVFTNANPVTDINNIELIGSKGINVYPNPFIQFITINASEVYPYTIFDLQGNMLETGNSQTISIGAKLPAGFYQLKVNNDVFKLVKVVN